jgi:hypothetical protein
MLHLLLCHVIVGGLLHSSHVSGKLNGDLALLGPGQVDSTPTTFLGGGGCVIGIIPFFVRVPPDVLSLQLCTPKVFGV